jgi:predicted nucleotidyltransferase component of viral defense system
MSAVSPILKQTILELQNLPSISQFALGGGTNLALRYDHRISIDIDFIAPLIIGRVGFDKIIEEVENLYGKKQVNTMLLNKELDEQFLFLRMFISKNDEVIKVEFLQNMKCLFNPEVFEDIRVIHKTDIGLFKLMSASNRFAKKDIYDLDHITDEMSLVELFGHFKIKSEKFNQPKHQTIFDLDNEINPIDKPELLLEFDNVKSSKENRPSHSNDRIEVLESSKTWQLARLSWRSKVRQLFSHLGKDFPNPTGIRIK